MTAAIYSIIEVTIILKRFPIFWAGGGKNSFLVSIVQSRHLMYNRFICLIFLDKTAWVELSLYLISLAADFSMDDKW